MGDEKKVSRLYKEVKDFYEAVKKEKISNEAEQFVDKKYEQITEIYLDFIDNYLDFREISNNLFDGIYIANGKGVTLFVNEAYVHTTGIARDKLIGRTVKEITEEGLYKGAVTMDVIAKKKPVNSLGKSLVNNRDLLVSGSPILDEDGEVRLVVINNRDISKLKELEETNAKLNQDKKRADEEIVYLRRMQMSDHIILGKEMFETMELIDTIAPTDVTVLITGESGTGKEVAADGIYQKSLRKEKPFIKVNCAAIPDELLESELFGYEGGAFTDAKKTGKTGLFELANGGTILLDEIGEMPMSLQSKLLRVLQTKEIRRIGGNEDIQLDIRVIASTNKDLQEEIKHNRFREDLYYRLNVVPILIKPLRERKEIIPPLTQEFINKYNKKYGKNTWIQEESIKLLLEYPWPGNIRELENLIERMVVINTDGILKYTSLATILALDIHKSEEDSKEPASLKEAVENLEKKMIVEAVQKYGSVNKAAVALGLSQPALWKKCKKLDIQ